MKPQFPEISGWLYDHEFLALKQLAQGKTVLEIGAFQGRSTVAFAQGAKYIVTVDHFGGDEFTEMVGSQLSRETVIEAFARNTKPYMNKITCVVSDMYKALPFLNPRDYDVIFYDAGHTAEDAKFFCDWALDARDDTTIALHDYKPNEEVWQPSAVVMDEYKIQTGRSTMLVGSLFIATHEPIPHSNLLGTEDHPYENLMLDANL
jgi:predicted O-methyltransferase YrrM